MGRNGGVELIETSLIRQADLATELVAHVGAEKNYFCYGTPYHTSEGGEDYEDLIAREFNGEIKDQIILDVDGVILNAMGLPNPGYDFFLKELDELNLKEPPIIVSILGGTPEEFVEVAKALEDYGIKLLEVNISCPHSKEKSGKLIIGQDLKETEKVITKIKDEIEIPILVKLTPNVPVYHNCL